MKSSNKVARAVHDLALGAWFGGTLMGAVGLNAASKEIESPSDRSRVANAGWAKWTPLNLAAIAGYLASGAIITKDNKGRLASQEGVARSTLVKTGLTGLALAATAYSRVLGQRVMNRDGVSVHDGVTPDSQTPADVAKAQRQLKMLQWAIPAHVGSLIALSSQMGEQQRPLQVLKGLSKHATKQVAARISA
ncbi:MAG: hypothetical protein LC750_05660 [Actinobacteria bacterium]|nr:hypothetical protein [Actinomycetota bacterium]